MSSGITSPSRIANKRSVATSSLTACSASSSQAKPSLFATLGPHAGSKNSNCFPDSNSAPSVRKGLASFLPHPRPFAAHLPFGLPWLAPRTATQMSTDRTSSTFRTTLFNPIIVCVPHSWSELPCIKKSLIVNLYTSLIEASCRRSCVRVKYAKTLCACSSTLISGCSDGMKPRNETIATDALALAESVPSVKRRMIARAKAQERGRCSPAECSTDPHRTSQHVLTPPNPWAESKCIAFLMSVKLSPSRFLCCSSIALMTNM